MKVVNSFSIAHIDSQGLHHSWYCFLLRLKNGQRRPPCTDAPPSGFRAISLNSWARDCGCGNLLVPIGQRWFHRYRQLQLSHSPLEVIQALHLQSGHSTFYLLETKGLQLIGLKPQTAHLLPEEISLPQLTRTLKKIGKTR